MRHPNQSSRAAFSLLELSMVLMLAGLIAAGLMTYLNVSGKQQCYATTKAQLQRVREAIERYAMSNDRFPLPAQRNLGTTDPQYGREVALASISSLDTVTNPDGTVAVYGALPFATLGIARDESIDCWGNKLTYVSTKDLADPAQFRANTDGALSINSGASTTFLAHGGYAVISHGSDEFGAVKDNYSTTSNTVADRKWCNYTATKWGKTGNCNATSATLFSAPFNDGKDAGAAYFDDLIIYRGKPWRSQPYCPLCWFIPFVAGAN